MKANIERELNFILAIISSYKGHRSVYPLLERVLLEIKYDETITSHMNDSLISTGLVHGEYGLVEAYKSKLHDVTFWLKDDNANVVKLAHLHYARLKRMTKQETERVDEQVVIEKHKFGVSHLE